MKNLFILYMKLSCWIVRLSHQHLCPSITEFCWQLIRELETCSNFSWFNKLSLVLNTLVHELHLKSSSNGTFSSGFCLTCLFKLCFFENLLLQCGHWNLLDCTKFHFKLSKKPCSCQYCNEKPNCSWRNQTLPLQHLWS